MHRKISFVLIITLLFGMFNLSFATTDVNSREKQANPSPKALNAKSSSQTQGAAITLTSTLSEIAKRNIEKQIVLYLEEISDGEGMDDTLLNLFYSATDTTVNNILKTCEETLQLLEEVNIKVNNLTIAVEDLEKQIAEGFANNKYNNAATLLNNVSIETVPMWEDYCEIINKTENDSTYTDEMRQRDITGFMTKMNARYGGIKGRMQLEDDIHSMYLALYANTGKATFCDAQEELSKINHPFEHQIVDEVKSAFNYGVSLQVMVLAMYQEYAIFCEENPNAFANESNTLKEFEKQGSKIIENLNYESQYVDVDKYLDEDKINTSITTQNGKKMDAYHVKSNSDGKEYMIVKAPVTYNEGLVRGTGKDPAFTYWRVEESMDFQGYFESANGRWRLPNSEAELETLFDPAKHITNPTHWMLNDGGLVDIKKSDAILLNDYITTVDDKNSRGHFNYFYSFKHSFIDSASVSLTPDAFKVDGFFDTFAYDPNYAKSYNGRYDDTNKSHKYINSGTKPIAETELLLVYFDLGENASTMLKDKETGYYTPLDVGGIPSELWLTDGDVLDLRKLGEKTYRHLNNTVVHVDGDVRIIGDGQEFYDMQIKVGKDANLTIENLKINHTKPDINPLAIMQDNVSVKVVGSCSFQATKLPSHKPINSAVWLSRFAKNTEIKGDGRNNSTLSLKRGQTEISADVDYYDYFDFYNHFYMTKYNDGQTLNIEDISITPLSDSCQIHNVHTVRITDSYVKAGDSNVEGKKLVFNNSEIRRGRKEIFDVTADNSTIYDNGAWNVNFVTMNKDTASTGNDVYMSMQGQTVTSKDVNTNSQEIMAKLTDYDHFRDNASYNKDFVYETDEKMDMKSITIRKDGNDGVGIERINIQDKVYADRKTYNYEIHRNLDEKKKDFVFAPSSVTSENDGKVEFISYTGSDIMKFLEREKECDINIPLWQKHKDLTLSTKVLDSIRSNDHTLRLFSIDKEGLLYGWRIQPGDIKDSANDMNLKIDIDKADAKNLTDVVGDKNAVILDFAHEGKLPGKMDVRINAERYGFEPGTMLEVVRIEGDDVTVVDRNVEVEEIGLASVKLDHCSSYALRTQENDGGGAKTADDFNLTAMILLLLLCAACMIIMQRFNKETDKL